MINHVELLCKESKAEPKCYWINSGGNSLVKRFISKANKTTRDEIERLIAGEPIEQYHRLVFGMMSLCKDYLKDRSAGRAGLNGYSAVMDAHDFMNQGQPEAYSAKLAASGFIYAEEWFKYAFF